MFVSRLPFFSAQDPAWLNVLSGHSVGVRGRPLSYRETLTRFSDPGIVLVPESGGFYPDLNVRHNLDFFRLLGPLPAEAAPSQEIASQFGLEEELETPARELDRGRAMLLALACAAAQQPRVMLVADPFVGTDDFSRRLAVGILRDLKQAGLGLVLVSLDEKLLTELCEETWTPGKEPQ